MEDTAPETQFSIYRIDCERVESAFEIKANPETPQYVIEVYQAILYSTIDIVKRKGGEFQTLAYKGFEGIVFKTEHDPMWKPVVSKILRETASKLSEEEQSSYLKNVNVSYILLYLYENCIYAVTGGFGSMYISKFANRNFGLYLIPKVVTINKPVLRSLTQNHLSGNSVSTQRSNRKVTNFNIEKDMSSIFRQLNIEIDDVIARSFGIVVDPEEAGRKISVLNKDSIVFHRNFSIDELKNIIHRIDDLWEREDNFALNYLVLAQKKGYKAADLLDTLRRTLYNLDLSKFILVGDDFSNYVVNGRLFILYDDNQNEYIIRASPISLQDIFEEFVNQEKKITLGFMDTFLRRWSIKVLDHDGNEVVPQLPIFESLQGYIEHGTRLEPIYLFNGEWYVFDIQYAQSLTREYQGAFDRYQTLTASLLQNFALRFAAANEEAYNQSLKDIEGVIVAHKVTPDYVEIADAIFSDQDFVYFMHNKKKFDGEGARDVTGQIVTSAEYLQNIINSLNRDEALKNYYRAIVDRRGTMANRISEDDFVHLITHKKVCYIAGYLENYKKDTNATYAEYLTVETERRLNSRGYAFFTMGLTPD